MRNAAITHASLLRIGAAKDDTERKLASFDVGMVVAISMGVMVTARMVNLMAGWM